MMIDSLIITPYQAEDRDAVLALAPRLAVGVAAWRPTEGVASAVREWFEESVEGSGDDQATFVARLDGEVVGMVAVSTQRHWSGNLDAYVGELATAAGQERRGIGRALLARAEQWATARGLAHITLETGAANADARAFYGALGYLEEEIRLTRVLKN